MAYSLTNVLRNAKANEGESLYFATLSACRSDLDTTMKRIKMRNLQQFCILAGLLFLPLFVSAQDYQVELINNEEGSVLKLNGEPFIVNGMNWDYLPIGTNYTYNFWSKTDNFIKAALDDEMSLLKNMGVNAIRVYTGIPKRWITYIYDTYGISTMLNHSYGRYGLTIDGAWVPITDYASPKVEEILIGEVSEMAAEYEGTRGLLCYLLGNENNYGLFWDGAETEDIPVEERKSTKRAQAMYSLINKGSLAIKAIDGGRPIAFSNGDLLFLDIIAEECGDLDIFGTNMYRGISFRDAFDRVRDEYGKPIMFTEFGADAFNAVSNSEDQESQAYYMVGNWKEIYANAAGMGNANNSIGGFTFQFSDGWWKFGQTKNLTVHDNNASWSNGGYQSDFIQGENNMNEEWFGICAKGPSDVSGLYTLYPRAAYYALKKVHEFDPYGPEANSATLESFFSNEINLSAAALEARGDKAALESQSKSIASISRFSARFNTYSTGGSLVSTPQDASPNVTQYPDELGFDHMQTFFVGVQANPAPNVQADVEFSMVGNVAENPIDEIFYENPSRQGENPFRLYGASLKWNEKWFNLDAFFRKGHYHWGYEGDFFGLYPEAYYGPNLDIYNGQAPLGFEIEGKKSLSGFKVAMGPELWWGANPAVLAKYYKEYNKFTFSAIFHEDLEQRGNTQTAFAIPQPKTRRATAYLERSYGKFGVGIGGIWAGSPLIGRTYQVLRGDEENPEVYEATIRAKDNWGGKVKLTYTGGRFNWYASGAAMGLVAGGGGDQTMTYTGWRLKDSGSGNQYNVLSGLTYQLGDLQIAPNFLWQKPIEGPMQAGLPSPARLRNILDDPFVVRANREQLAGELLLTFDPTPATYYYEWNNDFAEDAKFAMNAGFVYRHLPTSQDASIAVSQQRTFFPFSGAAPAQDLWEAYSRIVSKINPNLGFIANFYGGTAQANGDSERTIKRMGGDVRLVYRQMKINTAIKVNDWGPYDYHRDFNLTYPLQLILDVSTTLGKPSWEYAPQTQFGILTTWRSLDQYSNRYCPATYIDANGNEVCVNDLTGYANGNEWELRVYLHMNFGATR